MTYKPVRRNNELRNEVLSNLEARAIYEATKLQIDLSMKLKKARIKSNMTQSDVADIMHTKKPAISRIESVGESVSHFLSLLTLVKYASAIGYELNFGLTPIHKTQQRKKKIVIV
jgi:DNA-binding XRE family transcriptional regulator